MRKIKLVSDARNVWRWYSTWAVGFSSGLMGAWSFLPDDLKAALPWWVVTIFAVFNFVFFVGARVVQQFEVKNAPE